MSEPAQPNQPQKVRIATASDLFGALRSDSSSKRLFVLKAIVDNPGKALSYGEFQGGNLRDEVVTLWQQSEIDTDERAVALAAIVALGGDNAFPICKSDFSFSRNRGVLRVAASRLALEPVEHLADFLRPFLFDDGLPTRTRLTATLMSGFPALSPQERLRVAIISMDQGTCLPPMPELDTDGFWISELKGIWAEEAKVMAEGMGEEVFRRLVRTWNALPEDAKLWLIEWGMRDHPLHAAGLVADVLRSDNTKLVLASLQSIGKKVSGAGFFQTQLNELVNHSMPVVRAAALDAGGLPKGFLLRKMLVSEPPEVRLALIQSIAKSKDQDYARDLAGLFRDEDWRIRAAASAALAAMGGAIIEELKPLLTDLDDGVRVAAMNTLFALGDESLVLETMREKVDTFAAAETV